MRISVLGGYREVGGNKILVEDRDGRVMLDFGKSFGVWKRYFTAFVNPSKDSLKHYLTPGLLPKLKNVYRRDMGADELGLWEGDERGLDGVLISHAHADHYEMLFALEPDIPIYCGELCLGIMKNTLKKKRDDKRFFNPGGREREFRTFRSGDPLDVGIKVRAVHVDHSIPGSYGFILETSEGCVVYSGDLRLHGTSPQLTRDFIEEARECEPEYLLLEGTRIGEEDGMGEEDVFNTCLNETKGEEGLIVLNFNVRDVDRLGTFVKLAEELGRELVITEKWKGIVELYGSDEKLKRMIPTPDRHPFLIYGGEGENRIEADEIKRNPGRYMLAIDPYKLPILLDVEPEGGTFIDSQSEPFDEESELDHERLMNWVKLFGLKPVRAHSHGHADKVELKEIVEGIRPKKLIPIHTESPELFKKLIGYDRLVLDRVIEVV